MRVIFLEPGICQSLVSVPKIKFLVGDVRSLIFRSLLQTHFKSEAGVDKRQKVGERQKESQVRTCYFGERRLQERKKGQKIERKKGEKRQKRKKRVGDALNTTV